jgi:hypothetical protein
MTASSCDRESAAVQKDSAASATASRATQLRLITALTNRAVLAGVLDPVALHLSRQLIIDLHDLLQRTRGALPGYKGWAYPNNAFG